VKPEAHARTANSVVAWRRGNGTRSIHVTKTSGGWTVLHDGQSKNDYATKEAAFEAAVAAASLAIKEGHEVHVSVPGRDGEALSNR
jgi:ribosomal protein S11